MTFNVQQNRPVIFACLFYSFFSFMASLYFEVYKGKVPCLFCSLQRFSLIGILIGSVCCLTFYHNHFCNILLKAALICCLAVSVTHLTIQFGWMPDFCTVSHKIKSIEDFNNLLYASKPFGCSEIYWKIAGVPASVFNVLFPIGISIFSKIAK